jgi:hypothetical protein
MAGTFVDVLVAVLVAIFAIGAILFIFAVAINATYAVMQAFKRSILEGLGYATLCATVLFAVVFGVHWGWPYAVDFYHGFTN